MPSDVRKIILIQRIVVKTGKESTLSWKYLQDDIYDDIFNDFGCMPGEHTCTITANHNCNI